MEIDQFDALTREMCGSSRRQVLRTLWSTLLAGAVVSLGLPEFAQANAKRHKARHKHTSDARQAHPPARGVRSAGKGRGKKKKSHRRNPPPASPLPPGPGPVCAADEKRCLDRETPSGFSCIPAANCCLDQKKCGDACIYRQACCEEDRPQCGPCDEPYCDMQGNYRCAGTCCAGERPCGDGSCVAQGQCCRNETPCAWGGCAAPGQCCPELQCGEGCCPDDMTCHHTGTCCRPRTPEEGGIGLICQCASGYSGGAGCTANGQCCRYGCCYPDCCPAPQP